MLFLLLSVSIFGNYAAAQQINLTGTVTDQDGNPLAGVTVLVKGTTKGTLTDVDGKYLLQDVPSNAVISFSFVGMETQEIPLEGRTLLNVTMKGVTIGLEEVVVVGYGTQTRRNLTGSVSAITDEGLKSSVAPSISQKIAGKVTGINSRITDGRPGSVNAIQIRNYGTPLYIIDGVPRTESDFNMLGPNDVESISILKDASASIYGLLASNGVVLVTTKMGKPTEKSTINVSGYYGLMEYTRFPHPPNAYEFKLGLAESDQNRGITPTITAQELQRWKEGLYDPANGLDYRSFDYYDFVIKQKFPYPQYFLNAGASGASDKSSFFSKVSNIKQDSPLPSHYYTRTNIQSNLEAKLAQGLKIGTQISARRELRHSSGLPGWDDYANLVTSVIRMWPTERPYANDNPNYVNNTHSININPGTFPERFTGYADNLERIFRGNVYAEYDFGFGLKVRGTFGYGYSFDDDEYFEYTYDAYTYDRLTDTYNVVPGGGNQNPFRANQRTTNEDLFVQLQGTFNKKIKKHSINAVAAYELSNNAYTFIYLHTIPPNNYIIPMYFADLNELSNSYSKSARASVIGRVNYNYDERYLIEILGRYDGSYLYAPGNRWGLFPGISVGWRISNEEFFTPLKNIISDLKLRASWGKTGSETGVSAFAYQSGFTWGSGNYIFNGSNITGIRPTGLPVTNLSWVNNITTNIGFDMSLFKGRINTQFDIFKRLVTGIPAARYDVLLPSEVGYSLPNENLNKTGNYGVEGMITYNGKIGQVNYSVGGNATLARRRNIETYKPRFGNSWDEYRNSTEDRWSSVNWGYKVIGQFQSQQEIDDYAVDIDGSGNRTLLPGDLIYADLNEDKIINSMDMLPIGYPAGGISYSNQTGTMIGNTSLPPLLNFGIQSSFEYKGFNVAINFTGASMQTFTMSGDLKIPFNRNGASTRKLLTDRWHRSDPFDANSEWIPGYYPPTRKDVPTHSNFSRTNTFYTVNINYLRLRDFEIGYTLPSSWIQKLRIENLRVYINMSNLFSIDNVRKFHIDPEISVSSGLTVPQTRSFNFGFTCNI